MVATQVIHILLRKWLHVSNPQLVLATSKPGESSRVTTTIMDNEEVEETAGGGDWRRKNNTRGRLLGKQ